MSNVFLKKLLLCLSVIFLIVLLLLSIYTIRLRSQKKHYENWAKEYQRWHEESGFIQFANVFHILVITEEYFLANNIEMALAWNNILFTMVKESGDISVQQLAYTERGTIRLAAGDYPGAIEDYSNAIALETNGITNFKYYLVRGNAYRLQGDIGSALKDYCQFIHFFTNGIRNGNTISDIAPSDSVTSYCIFYDDNYPPDKLVEYLEQYRDLCENQEDVDHCLKLLKNIILPRYNELMKTYKPIPYKPKFVKPKDTSKNWTLF